MEGNTRPINIFSLFFIDELTDNLVEWTNSNYAQKKRLQPDKHRMKWTDTYPDKIRAFLAVLIIMNDMIIVCDLSVILDPKIRNGTSDTRNNYYFYKDRLKQSKRYFHFYDPNVPVPVVNDPAHASRLYLAREV